MLVDVATDPLNVRRTPEKIAGNVFKQLSNKHPVQAYETRNGFRRITTMLIAEAIEGWVSAQFLKPAGEAMTVDVTNTPLNVRRTADQSAGNVFAKLPKGHPVLAFETQNGFRRIRATLDGDAIDGWASVQFLKKA